jgi:hypothetical protein
MIERNERKKKKSFSTKVSVIFLADIFAPTVYRTKLIVLRPFSLKNTERDLNSEIFTCNSPEWQAIQYLKAMMLICGQRTLSNHRYFLILGS